MAYEHRELSGSLFVNDRKTKDNQPDLTGTMKMDGKTWRLAAWKSDKIEGMLSLKISEFQQQDGFDQAKAAVGSHNAPGLGAVDDDCPF